MKVKFWGVRGSLPSPLTGSEVNQKIRKILSYASPKDLFSKESIEYFIKTIPYSLASTYGSNTSCLEIRSSNNDLLIINAGTGICPLGRELIKAEHGTGDGECHFIITHTNWEHIQGLPYFAPLNASGNLIHFHSIHQDLEERLSYQHNMNSLSQDFGKLMTNNVFHYYNDDDNWEVNGIVIKRELIDDLASNYIYRFEEGDKSFVFCANAGFAMPLEKNDNLDQYIDFFQETNLLIFDTHDTLENKIQKIDIAHSNSQTATDFAIRSNTQRLALYQYDPSCSDDDLNQVFLQALEYMEENQERCLTDIDIMLAYEGLELEL